MIDTGRIVPNVKEKTLVEIWGFGYEIERGIARFLFWVRLSMNFYKI